MFKEWAPLIVFFLPNYECTLYNINIYNNRLCARPDDSGDGAHAAPAPDYPASDLPGSGGAGLHPQLRGQGGLTPTPAHLG